MVNEESKRKEQRSDLKRRAAITEGVRDYPHLKSSEVALCYCCYCHHRCSVLAVAFLLQVDTLVVFFVFFEAIQPDYPE